MKLVSFNTESHSSLHFALKGKRSLTICETGLSVTDTEGLKNSYVGIIVAHHLECAVKCAGCSVKFLMMAGKDAGVDWFLEAWGV